MPQVAPEYPAEIAKLFANRIPQNTPKVLSVENFTDSDGDPNLQV